LRQFDDISRLRLFFYIIRRKRCFGWVSSRIDCTNVLMSFD